jgi:DNA-binding IclR family transcriptional regulator
MQTGGVAAIDRAFSILDSFKSGERSLTLQDLETRTNLNKATIIRLIASLEKAGCMIRLSRGEYALGPGLLGYGALYQSSFHLSDHLVPALRNLVRQSGETAAFFIRDGDTRVCLHRTESGSALRFHIKEGERHPLLPSGTGKVLLAFSGGIGPEFEKIRRDYVVRNIGERRPEISSVSAPVLGAGGELVGAISLTGPTGNFDNEKTKDFLNMLLPVVAELTRLCGGDPQPFLDKVENA